MPLLTEPLSPQERRALALRRAGKTNGEVADDMMITNSHVATLLTGAKRKGALVPKAPRGKPGYLPIERLVELRATLRAAGRRSGICRIIAERTGLKIGCVRVRLWRYDQEHKQARAA